MSIQRRGLSKIKVGHIVEVTFLDHVSTVGGVSEPIMCRVVGQVIAKDKRAICTASWISMDNEPHNLDTHTILIAAIISIKRLKK